MNQRLIKLEAVAYIRDDAPGGNPPALYLLPQIKGGSAYRTRFAKRLGREARDPSRSWRWRPNSCP
jgi:hypothetical protein